MVLSQMFESAHILIQLGILQQAVESLIKRLKLKNDVISEPEENAKMHNSEMLKLQDEVLSWEIHTSRQDNSFNSSQ